jgi:hypothetical protein
MRVSRKRERKRENREVKERNRYKRHGVHPD